MGFGVWFKLSYKNKNLQIRVRDSSLKDMGSFVWRNEKVVEVETMNQSSCKASVTKEIYISYWEREGVVDGDQFGRQKGAII